MKNQTVDSEITFLIEFIFNYFKQVRMTKLLIWFCFCLWESFYCYSVYFTKRPHRAQIISGIELSNFKQTVIIKLRKKHLRQSLRQASTNCFAIFGDNSRVNKNDSYNVKEP